MDQPQPPVNSLMVAGRQALICFLISAVVFTTSFFTSLVLGYTNELRGITFWGPALYLCLFSFVLRYIFQGFLYEVSIRSSFLGAAFATGLFVSTSTHTWRIFGLYVMVLSSFHFSEFLVMAICNPRTLSVDSFVLNHSRQYTLAAVASWMEFLVEYYYFPWTKSAVWLSSAGVLVCIFGEFLRKGAMFTAKTNFTHTVQFEKHPDHRLVTHGVYALCRHPSYVGWFYWSIGTQLILLNPICFVVYALASWSFFNERIFAEEATLLAFFGQRYNTYQSVVGTGLPFIKGYIPSSGRRAVTSDHWSY